MSEDVIAYIMNDKPVTVSKKTTLFELSKNYKKHFKFEILLAKVNNELYELQKTLVIDSKVEFLDITDANGFRAYQRSVVFLMVYAIKEVMSRDTNILVEHSINKNYYCEFESKEIKVTDELLLKVENKMNEVIKQNIEIEKKSFPLEEAIQIAESLGLKDTKQLLRYKKTSFISLYKLKWLYYYFNGELAPNTGCLHYFKLHKRDEGFLLQFTSRETPNIFEEVKSMDKISAIFKESKNWAKILKVDTLGSLNDIICNEGIEEIIKVSEALHEKKISNLADTINKQNKMVVLIAGPTSSGKTTFAERLSIQLRASGKLPHVISLDNYFKNIEEAPLDECGKVNLEAVDFVDIEKLNEDLTKLMKRETILLPSYNFKTGKREYNGKALTLKENEVLILEGIHGLNKRLSESVAQENKFKIFISALTQLNIDSHNRITTSDNRLIRRIVRDNKYRYVDAATTISMWTSVLRGENENIFPYQEEADGFFNSALIYEMCILKQFVEPLLFRITNDQPEYTEARRLIEFLEGFFGVNTELVPKNSILREFVGGGYLN